MTATPFGDVLRGLREARGFSQVGLAARAGLDHTSVSRLEGGSRRAARETVGRLAEGLRLVALDRRAFFAAAGFIETSDHDRARDRMSTPKNTTPFEPGQAVRIVRDGKNGRQERLGTFCGLSRVGGQPLVDIPGKGRHLIPARYLEPYDGEVPKPERPGPPLADTLPPREIAPEPDPPPLDWFERPPEPEPEPVLAGVVPGNGGEPAVPRQTAVDVAAREREVSAPSAEHASDPVTTETVAPANPHGNTGRMRGPLSEEHKRKISEGKTRNREARQASAAVAVTPAAVPPVSPLVTAATPAPFGSPEDELTASLMAMRRAIASAAIEGRDVTTLQRLVATLSATEQSVGSLLAL